jgi:REP element-mobilizing transposase RayT
LGQSRRQLTLDQARKPTGRGGWRPGAGRPRVKGACAHTPRTAFAASEPVHVTLRIARGVPNLRRERVVRAVRAVIMAGGHRDDFHVVHFNLLSNHLHLLVEAADRVALARGMQGLGVRLAQRINAVLGRTGRLLAQRYHARALRSPREVRVAIRYVLLNARDHAAERGQQLARGWVDPFSSAIWFDGWRNAIRTDAPWLRELARDACPTAPARTWLLAVGWRRGGGAIDVDDVPGPAP